jgi:hypothetical protein
MGLGSGIPDPGVKKAPDPGCGSARLHAINNCIQDVFVFKKFPQWYLLNDNEKNRLTQQFYISHLYLSTEKLTYVWSLPIRRELEVKHVTPRAHAAILILGNLSAIFDKWWRHYKL